MEKLKRIYTTNSNQLNVLIPSHEIMEISYSRQNVQISDIMKLVLSDYDFITRLVTAKEKDIRWIQYHQPDLRYFSNDLIYNDCIYDNGGIYYFTTNQPLLNYLMYYNKSTATGMSYRKAKYYRIPVSNYNEIKDILNLVINKDDCIIEYGRIPIENVKHITEIIRIGLNNGSDIDKYGWYSGLNGGGISIIPTTVKSSYVELSLHKHNDYDVEYVESILRSYKIRTKTRKDTLDRIYVKITDDLEFILSLIIGMLGFVLNTCCVFISVHNNHSRLLSKR